MIGNEDRAYEYLNLLVTRFPDHPLNVQAHLRLGEYWLLKRKYAKAIEQYEKVPLDYPGNEAGLALYHRAEAYYNMADFENAARWYYEYVVPRGRGQAQGRSSRRSHGLHGRQLGGFGQRFRSRREIPPLQGQSQVGKGRLLRDRHQEQGP